jgi:hypothetical protein
MNPTQATTASRARSSTSQGSTQAPSRRTARPRHPPARSLRPCSPLERMSAPQIRRRRGRYLWLPLVHASSLYRGAPPHPKLSFLPCSIPQLCIPAAGSCYLSSLVRHCKPTPPIPLLVDSNCMLLAKATCDPRQFANVYKSVELGVRKQGGII